MRISKLRTLIQEAMNTAFQEARPKGSKNKPKAPPPPKAPQNNVLVSSIGKWIAKYHQPKINEWIQETIQGEIREAETPDPEVIFQEVMSRIQGGSMDISGFMDDHAFDKWFGNYLERLFASKFIEAGYDEVRGMQVDTHHGSAGVSCHFLGTQVDPDVEIPDRNDLKDTEMDRMLESLGAQQVRVTWSLEKYDYHDYYYYVDYAVRFSLVWDPGAEFSKLVDPGFVRNEINAALSKQPQPV